MAVTKIKLLDIEKAIAKKPKALARYNALSIKEKQQLEQDTTRVDEIIQDKEDNFIIESKKEKTNDSFDWVNKTINLYLDGTIVTVERELEPVLRGEEQVGYRIIGEHVTSIGKLKDNQVIKQKATVRKAVTQSRLDTAINHKQGLEEILAGHKAVVNEFITKNFSEALPIVETKQYYNDVATAISAKDKSLFREYEEMFHPLDDLLFEVEKVNFTIARKTKQLAKLDNTIGGV